MSVRFEHVVKDQGAILRLYEIRLLRKSGPIPWESWDGKVERRLDRFLRALVSEERVRPLATDYSCRIGRSPNCLMRLL